MIRNSLKLKIGIYLALALSVAVVLFTLMVVRNNRDELLSQTVSHTSQLSEVIMKSTRFAMQHNRPEDINRIITDVGAHADIDRVRILSKEGEVIHSSQPEEIGTMVDQEAESCLGCHLDERSMEESPMFGRPRIFSSPEGRRLLGSTAVIRNEPTCSDSTCHAHPADETELGVLDIVAPLQTIDSIIRRNTITLIALSLAFVALAAALDLGMHRLHLGVAQPDQFDFHVALGGGEFRLQFCDILIFGRFEQAGGVAVHALACAESLAVA